MGKHNQSSGPKRKQPTRRRRRYLIVSEDSKSSLDYFLSFPVDSSLVEIVPEGGAGNTQGVVQRGIDLQKAAIAEGSPFVHVYCVFDKDSFPLDRYQAAFDKVRMRNDMSAIWANESFELWYLLHYAYHHTSIGRHEIIKRFA